MTLPLSHLESLFLASLAFLMGVGCADESMSIHQPVEPSVSMVSIGASAEVYVLKLSGILEHKTGPTKNPYPTDVFSYVSVGDHEVCAIRPSGALTCWGERDFLDLGPYEQVDLASGQAPICAVRRDDQGLRCWSFDFAPLAIDGADGRYQKVAVGAFEQQIWALREDGTLACWKAGQPCPSVPPGRFLDIDFGQYGECAVEVEGSLVCWNSIVLPPPPNSDFIAVSIGPRDLVCALRRDHGIACWGNFTRPGEFRQVASGDAFSCGVRMDDAFFCWGAVPLELGPRPACAAAYTRP